MVGPLRVVVSLANDCPYCSVVFCTLYSADFADDAVDTIVFLVSAISGFNRTVSVFDADFEPEYHPVTG